MQMKEAEMEKRELVVSEMRFEGGRAGQRGGGGGGGGLRCVFGWEHRCARQMAVTWRVQVMFEPMGRSLAPVAVAGPAGQAESRGSSQQRAGSAAAAAGARLFMTPLCGRCRRRIGQNWAEQSRNQSDKADGG